MSNPQAAPFIGSKISLISRSEIRYEGILYTIDTKESTVALQNVRSFGTEGRKKDGDQIPPSNEVYDYIIFRGADIKDLHVAEAPAAPAQPRPPQDPAIISSQSQQKLPPYQAGYGPQYPSGAFPPMPPPYQQQFGQQPGQFQSYPPPMYPPQYGSFPQPPPQQQPTTTATSQPPAPGTSVAPKSTAAAPAAQEPPPPRPQPSQAPQPQQQSADGRRAASGSQQQQQQQQQSHHQPQQQQNFQRSSGGSRGRPRNAPSSASESKPADGSQAHLAGGHHHHQQQQQRGGYRGGQRRGGGGNGGVGNGNAAGRGQFNGSARPQAASFQDEFDLEAANAKFDKMKIFEEVQTQMAQSGPGAAAASSQGSAEAAAAGGTPADEAPVIIPPPPVSYDKQKSFFDNISCDAKDRAADRDSSKPRVSQADQRRLDQQTFGADALRGRSRGRGRGRGYGGPSRYPPSQQIHQMKSGGFQGQRGGGGGGGSGRGGARSGQESV